MDVKNKAFSVSELSEMFNELDGYYNYCNEDLDRQLISMKLLEEQNRKKPKNVATFIKWTFTTSFLQMVNAWQWFLAGVLLRQQAYVPAQFMQMYYYSIFFSYNAFLAAQIKGIRTVEIVNQEQHFLDHKKIRRCVWLDDSAKSPFIALDFPKGRFSDHERIALWFYEVFNDWPSKNEYPDVSAFIKEGKWHVYFRNLYTYSLADIAEELYCSPGFKGEITSKILIALWERSEQGLVDIFPEEFWALEHLKVITNLHFEFLDRYDKESPLKEQQFMLIDGLYRHHAKANLGKFLIKALEPFFVKIKAGTES